MGVAPDFVWDDAVIERLKHLWLEGHSTAEIGRRLGVSKNAVVGKAHRLPLPPRKSPIIRDDLTVEQKDRALALAATGASDSEIATAINSRTGVVRSLIGRRAPQLARAPRTRWGAQRTVAPAAVGMQALLLDVTPASASKKSSVTGEIVVATVSGRTEAGENVVTIFRKQVATCLWPLWGRWERPNHKYCGAPQKPGSSYCPKCHAKAFTPVRPGFDSAARLMAGLKKSFVNLTREA